jgi:hypothetical protein
VKASSQATLTPLAPAMPPLQATLLPRSPHPRAKAHSSSPYLHAMLLPPATFHTFGAEKPLKSTLVVVELCQLKSMLPFSPLFYAEVIVLPHHNFSLHLLMLQTFTY